MFLTWEACVTHDRCSGQWNMDGCTYVPDLRGLRNTWSLFRPVEHGWLHLCSWPERPAYTWPLFRPVEHGWLHLCSWPKTKRPASYISSVQASGTRMAAPMFLTLVSCVIHELCSGQWNTDGCTYVPDLFLNYEACVMHDLCYVTPGVTKVRVNIQCRGPSQPGEIQYSMPLCIHRQRQY